MLKSKYSKLDEKLKTKYQKEFELLYSKYKILNFVKNDKIDVNEISKILTIKMH